MSEPQKKLAYTATLYPTTTHGHPRIVWILADREDGWLTEPFLSSDNRDLPTTPVVLSKEQWSRDENKWLAPESDESIDLQELFKAASAGP